MVLRPALFWLPAPCPSIRCPPKHLKPCGTAGSKLQAEIMRADAAAGGGTPLHFAIHSHPPNWHRQRCSPGGPEPLKIFEAGRSREYEGHRGSCASARRRSGPRPNVGRSSKAQLHAVWRYQAPDMEETLKAPRRVPSTPCPAARDGEQAAGRAVDGLHGHAAPFVTAPVCCCVD